MCKKIVLSAVAALLMAAANLNLCCSVLVNGREVPGFYSPTRAEEMTAKVAAEAPEGTHPEALAIEAMRQCVLEALDYLGRLVQGEFAS